MPETRSTVTRTSTGRTQATILIAGPKGEAELVVAYGPDESRAKAAVEAVVSPRVAAGWSPR